ncbi:MAG: Sigma-70 region 2 [Frankiaceae bacterium]|jgi:DNA-directed RNA polymerase specialized sigma24 family protein|nr:Sigma-70 region 2 [Frankiaceae bacterium]
MTRSTSTSVTPEWTEWWPLMRKRLLRFLRSRGVSAHAAEDAVQDVAERLLTRQVPHTDVDDLMRWCMTVARNAAIDQHRRLRRSVSLDCCDDDTDDGSELVDTVEARMRLDRVLRALGTMSYDDVRCVMAGLDGEVATEAASPALRARRHRLRRRLSEMVGCFGLAGIVIRALRPRFNRASLGLSSAAVASVALVTVVTGGAPFGSGSDHLRLHVAPATVRVQPVADRAPVARQLTRPLTAPRVVTAPVHRAAHPAGRPGLHLRSPDKNGTIDVEGHDRGASDTGLVCIDGLKYVDRVCIGPDAGATQVTPVH